MNAESESLEIAAPRVLPTSVLDTPLKIADVFRGRIRRLNWLRADHARLSALKAYYRSHIADFINDWGITYVPHNAAKGLPVIVPFILDPKQRDWIDFTYQNWRDGAYAGTEKSREVGMSWLLVAFSIALCVLEENIIIGWGSFSEIKVDRRGDMGSLFEKGRAFLDGLPKEFKGGYDRDTTTTKMIITFPDTLGSIIGEIGDKIGRGGRCTIYFVDEAAHLERDAIVDAALSMNTRCRQDVSTVFGTTNSFATRMHDGSSRKFTYHWRDNPRFTEDDYAKFRKQWGPVITAQEMDIDYLASVEGVIIPQAHVQAMIDAHVKLGIKPSGILCGALDVADEGRDANAFAARHGLLVTHCSSWRGKGSFLHETTDRAYLLCDELHLEGFDYDADGMGAGVRSDVDRIEQRRKDEGLKKLRVSAYRGSAEVLEPDRQVRGTDRTAKDLYQNRKAQSWGELARRAAETARAVLEGGKYDLDMIVSLDSTIPELSELCIEFSQAQWKISANGKLMVDKTPDGAASPNMADSVVILFSPKPLPMKIADNFMDVFSDDVSEY